MWQMAILWSVVLVSLYTDLKERKIYNKVVVPGALAGLIGNVIVSGWSGMMDSLIGLAVGLGIFFIPFVLGGLGAGDVKLCGAIGAIMGAPFALYTALGTGIAGGVIAVIMLIRQGRLLIALKRIGLVLTAVFFSKQTASLKTLNQADYHESFPYGMAIAIGVFLAMFVR